MNERPNTHGEYSHRKFHPDFRHSFYFARPCDEIYLVNPPVLQTISSNRTPSVYDVLTNDDPCITTRFLGIPDEEYEKKLDIEALAKIKSAFEGTRNIVPFEHEHLLFPVAECQNGNNSLLFVGSACVENVIKSSRGEVGSVHLFKSQPYFLFYFTNKPGEQISNASFSSFVRKQFQFAKREPIQIDDTVKLARNMTEQLVNMLVSYPPETIRR